MVAENDELAPDLQVVAEGLSVGSDLVAALITAVQNPAHEKVWTDPVEGIPVLDLHLRVEVYEVYELGPDQLTVGVEVAPIAEVEIQSEEKVLKTVDSYTVRIVCNTVELLPAMFSNKGRLVQAEE